MKDLYRTILACSAALLLFAAPAYGLDVVFSATASVDSVVFPQTKTVSYDVTMQNSDKAVAFKLRLKDVNRALLFRGFNLVDGEAKLSDPDANLVIDPYYAYCSSTSFYADKTADVVLKANARATVRFTYQTDRAAPEFGSNYGARVIAGKEGVYSDSSTEVASIAPIPALGQYATHSQVTSLPAAPEADFRNGGMGRSIDMPVLKPNASFQVSGKTTPELQGQTVQLFDRLMVNSNDVNSAFFNQLVGTTVVDIQGKYRFPPVTLKGTRLHQLYIFYGGDATHAAHETCPLAAHTWVPPAFAKKAIHASLFRGSPWLHINWRYSTRYTFNKNGYFVFSLFANERRKTRSGRLFFRERFLQHLKAGNPTANDLFRQMVYLPAAVRKRIQSVRISVTYRTPGVKEPPRLRGHFIPVERRK